MADRERFTNSMLQAIDSSHRNDREVYLKEAFDALQEGGAATPTGGDRDLRETELIEWLEHKINILEVSAKEENLSSRGVGYYNAFQEILDHIQNSPKNSE